MFVYALPVSSAAVALSFSRSSKYFRNKNQEFVSHNPTHSHNLHLLQDIIYILKSLFKHLFNSLYGQNTFVILTLSQKCSF
jgi:hypothetical protein